MTKEELMYASDEDIAFYNKAIDGLPTSESGIGVDGQPLPAGLGPHSVRCLREIVSDTNPSFLLEIGFNMGWSSALWLALSESVKVYSCDISNKYETQLAATVLKNRYPDRFMYSNRKGVDGIVMAAERPKIDLIFIDGGHMFDDVVRDIWLALDLKIPFIAFDDIMPEFGEVQKGINEFPNHLSLIKELGNIALYKTSNV